MKTATARFPRRLMFAACSMFLIAPLALAQAPAANNQTSDGVSGGSIIVGPVRPHGFQLQTPNDGTVPADISNLDFAGILHQLGPDAVQWYQHVLTLSNPWFEGRAPGTEGAKHAAEYVEWWFRQYKLEPAFPEVAAADAGAAGDEEPGGALKEAAAWSSYRQPFDVRTRSGPVSTDNIGGVLRGKGELANEWVIIGGHYDHVGYGGRGNTVHPGADDNASGTAGVLLLAKRLSRHYDEAGDDANLRSVLFLAFGAEEMGLLGSRHYVQNPTLDADNVSLMINMDMIGRLRDNKLMVGGVGTAENFLDILKPHLEKTGLTIYADPTGRGPSDHSSFYGANIPVIFAFTGVHDIYHQPGDMGYTVNPVGAIRIVDLITDIAMDMVARAEKLVFTQSEQEQPRGRGRGISVSFGIMPAYGEELEKGVLVDDVFPNSSAADAGVKKGDLIIGWGGEELTDGGVMMQKLRDASPGDKVQIVILRDGKEMKLDVTLKARGG